MRDSIENGVLSYNQFQTVIGNISAQTWEKIMIRISSNMREINALDTPYRKAIIDHMGGKIEFH